VCTNHECRHPGCQDDAACDGLCSNLGVCEACSCLQGGCAVADIPGCCEDDTDCDEGKECGAIDHACREAGSTCAGADEPDAFCAGQCGTLEFCQKCSCDIVLEMCRKGAPVVGESCCLEDVDCNDGDAHTLDRCPGPGAACSHHVIP
jgi:hypothetical protein